MAKQGRPRSRTPCRPKGGPEALPPMRWDAPERRPQVARPALPKWSSDIQRQEALESLHRGIATATTKKSSQARLKTVSEACDRWGIALWPPTTDTIDAVAATLKQGGYRSASLYLHGYKVAAQRSGWGWSDVLQRAMVDAIRSCARGLGPSVQAQPLPLHGLYRLHGGRRSWVGGGGPACPRNAVVIGSWWLMREIELSTVRAGHLSLHGGVVSLLLPASKTDTQAFGASRSHRCGCGQGQESPGCPYHAAWDQLLWLQRTFPSQFDRLGRPLRDLPLFPDELGQTVSKAKMTESIVYAARLLGVQDAPDGAERVSGHSLRVTGAQGLVILGWPSEAVRLMGRWESKDVERFIRLAPLERILAFGPPGGPTLFPGFPPLGGASPASAPTLSPSSPGSSSACSSSSSGPATSPSGISRWVINLETGVHHVITKHRPSTSVCGWDFEDMEHAVVPPGAPGPVGHWDVCGLCDPELKGALAAEERSRCEG